MSYTLLPNDTVRRDEDGAIIPKVNENRDFMAYLAWLAEGNTPKVQPVLSTTDNAFGDDKPWL